MTQLSLFQTEEEQLRDELIKMKDQLGNLRRGIFKRFDTLVSEMAVIKDDVNEIKRHIGYKENPKVLEIPFLTRIE